MIDMFPDFRMRLKQYKKTGKVMFGADILSVFDICGYTYSRIVGDVALSIDQETALKVLSFGAVSNFEPSLEESRSKIYLFA